LAAAYVTAASQCLATLTFSSWQVSDRTILIPSDAVQHGPWQLRSSHKLMQFPWQIMRRVTK